MAGNAEEKRHPPSQRKLKKARERGEVAVSRELAGALGVLGAVSVLILGGRRVISQLVDLSCRCFAAQADWPWPEAIWQVVRGTLTVGAPTMFFAAAALVLQTGFSFRMRFDTARLNPLKGLRRIFSRQRLLDVLYSSFKVGLVFFTGAMAVVCFLAALPAATSDIEILAEAAAKGLVGLLAVLVAMAIACGIFDLWVQRRRFLKRMRMSRRELIEEQKEQEGDARLRAERRRLHRQLAQGVGLPAIGAARLVVTNPTHIAVALAYRSERDQAPWVVVSGWGSRAQIIRQAAARAAIPVVEHVELARGLIGLEWGEEISEEYYQAAAEVMAAVAEYCGEPASAPRGGVRNSDQRS